MGHDFGLKYWFLLENFKYNIFPLQTAFGFISTENDVVPAYRKRTPEFMITYTGQSHDLTCGWHQRKRCCRIFAAHRKPLSCLCIFGRFEHYQRALLALQWCTWRCTKNRTRLTIFSSLHAHQRPLSCPEPQKGHATFAVHVRKSKLHNGTSITGVLERSRIKTGSTAFRFFIFTARPSIVATVTDFPLPSSLWAMSTGNIWLFSRNLHSPNTICPLIPQPKFPTGMPNLDAVPSGQTDFTTTSSAFIFGPGTTMVVL